MERGEGLEKRIGAFFFLIEQNSFVPGESFEKRSGRGRGALCVAFFQHLLSHGASYALGGKRWS